jgi:hypothetical protein
VNQSDQREQVLLPTVAFKQRQVSEKGSGRCRPDLIFLPLFIPAGFGPALWRTHSARFINSRIAEKMTDFSDPIRISHRFLPKKRQILIFGLLLLKNQAAG